ncbi:hypothetical protein V2G26_002772 [Clonostachys chloroleuca]
MAAFRINRFLTGGKGIDSPDLWPIHDKSRTLDDNEYGIGSLYLSSSPNCWQNSFPASATHKHKCMNTPADPSCIRGLLSTRSVFMQLRQTSQ